jgi:hypothetical protein
MPSIHRHRRELPGRRLHHQGNPRCGSKLPRDALWRAKHQGFAAGGLQFAQGCGRFLQGSLASRTGLHRSSPATSKARRAKSTPLVLCTSGLHCDHRLEAQKTDCSEGERGPRNAGRARSTARENGARRGPAYSVARLRRRHANKDRTRPDRLFGRPDERAVSTTCSQLRHRTALRRVASPRQAEATPSQARSSVAARIGRAFDMPTDFSASFSPLPIYCLTRRKRTGWPSSSGEGTSVVVGVGDQDGGNPLAWSGGPRARRVRGSRCLCRAR